MSSRAPSWVRLSPLEIAAGVVVGSEPVAALPRSTLAPRAALERAVAPALAASPCLVSFSGGRDSSLVLAVAAAVARREGLAPPLPATIRFRSASRAGETEWQERVVAHLGLEDWVRIEIDDELDCVGPVAAEVLRRHGLLWPPNTHFHVPLLRAAAGGSLLTGIGGDEVLSTARWGRAAALLAGRVRPEPRDLFRVALALGPQPVRRVVLRRRFGLAFPWLHSGARSAVTEALVRDAAAEPLRVRQRLAWRLSLRYVRVGTASLELLGAEDGVRIVHPLADPEFCAALARMLRRGGESSRTAVTQEIAGGLLPREVTERPGKAAFWEAAWGPHSRAFAARWDGGGVDPELADVEALRRAFAAGERDGRLLLPLQAAWLATERSSAGELEEAVDRRGE